MATPNGSGITNRGTNYSDGSQVTSTNLKALVDDAVFNNNAVDDTTIGLNSSSPPALFVKGSSIDTAQLANNAVETNKILNNNVTLAKIEQVADGKILANLTGSTANASETDLVIGSGAGNTNGLLFDNNDMLDNDNNSGGSDTRGATQQSIKAYVDSEIANFPVTAPGGSIGSSGTVTLPGGLVMKFGTTNSTSDDSQTFTFPSAFPNACFFCIVNRTTANSQVQFPVTSKSRTNFKINRYNDVDGTQGITFFAIGN